MTQTGATPLVFRRGTDPQGPFAPGATIAWKDPNFDCSADASFPVPGRQAHALAART
jgi:hypothetical protein